MAMDDDLYDQDPREESGDNDKEQYGETFLAPKSAFAGKNLDVGSVHKVRVEATHDSEVELRCIQSDDKEKAVEEPETDEETASLYE